MSVNVQVIFYSMYGHVYQMAEAIAEGARQVPGANVSLYQVPELVPEEALKKSGAYEPRQKFAHIPVAKVADMPQADVLLFGTPTRFGIVCGQLKNFLDQTGGLWARGELVGRVGGVFGSTNSQHGGQESTQLSLMPLLISHGMIVTGVPYTCEELNEEHEIMGSSPYGAMTIVGHEGTRKITEKELAIARFQGRRTTEIGLKLRG